MRYTYNSSFYPPAPTIDILVALPLQAGIVNNMPCKALLDTGSDITVIPQNLIDILNPEPFGEVTAEFADGSRRQEVVYAIIVAIDGVGTKLVGAIGSIGKPHALLGRDIINDFVLHLEHRSSFFELT